MRNVRKVPRVWSRTELEEQAHLSLQQFVERRLREPRERYRKHIGARSHAILNLFKHLSGLDGQAPDPEVVRQILLTPELYSALRYVAGPPVSADDLGVLVTRSPQKLSKARIKTDDGLAIDILKLICSLSDPVRFPWIASQRKPSMGEIAAAVRSTAVLHASQTLLTERRGYGKVVEKKLESRLVHAGFGRAKAPAKASIQSPRDWPRERTFFGECTVYGRKSDLLIGTSDGRIVAVEAKDSSSIVNSVKRVLNDTAAKAKHWQGMAGQELVPVALLSGVFGTDNLEAAQDSGLYLVWAHDLEESVEWLIAQ
jgi:hypothetical protein